MDLSSCKPQVRMLFTDVCDIVTQTGVADGALTGFTESVMLANVPCRLSYLTISHARQNDKTAHVSGSATVFLPPEPEVPPGSLIRVVRNGRVIRLRCSGVPKYYETHQEIAVRAAETEA